MGSTRITRGANKPRYQASADGIMGPGLTSVTELLLHIRELLATGAQVITVRRLTP